MCLKNNIWTISKSIFKWNCHRRFSSAVSSTLLKTPINISEKLNSFKQLKFPESMFLIDNDVAKDISDVICTHLTRSYYSKPIKLIEANPGACLITQHIMDKTNYDIHVFENNNNEFLKVVHSVYTNRISITNANFLLLWKYGYQDRMDSGDRISKLLSSFGEPQPWNLASPSFQIIAALPNRKFLNYLIYSLMFQTGLMTYGRPEFYFLLQPSVYTRYSSKPIVGEVYYKTQSILFQTIFDLELLKTYPRTAFFPTQTLKSTSKYVRFKELKDSDNKFMLLVKVVGRQNLFEKGNLTVDLLKPYWYFVKHHTLSRKNFVIPMLEQWIPGCGPHFIAQGYTIFTQFGDLTPPQILDIFLKFVSLPEYNDSPFINAMESRIVKLLPSIPMTSDNLNNLQSTNDSLDFEESDNKIV